MQPGLMVLAFLLCLPAALLQAQNINTLSKKEKKQGWSLLFNGKDFSGWHIYLKPDAKPGWSIVDGAITTDRHNGGEQGDLVTDGSYANYELRLQWKIEKGGNSGIIFNVNEDPKYGATYVTGPEMQVLDNKDASDNKLANHLAGSLYDLIPADPKAVHPAGVWNTVKIRQENGHITFWMNDHKVVDTQIGDDHWKQMVSHSKFKDVPEFAAFRQGHIALQYHGGIVRYRNVKIRQL